MAEVRATVLGPSRSAQLPLPRDTPISELLANVVVQLTGREPSADDDWVIGLLGHEQTLAPESRLADHDVHDGVVLQLRNRRDASSPRPLTLPAPHSTRSSPAAGGDLSVASRAPRPSSVATPVPPGSPPASLPAPAPGRAAEGSEPWVGAVSPLSATAPDSPILGPPHPAAPPEHSLLQRTSELLPARRSWLARAGRSLASALLASQTTGDGLPLATPAAPPPAPPGGPQTARLNHPARYLGEPSAAPTSAPAPSPAALSVRQHGSPLARARTTWRATNYLRQLDRAIAAPRLRRCATMAVVSPKGGVGKTTVTALLGTLLALIRRDRVVAVDCNPDFGSLGRALCAHHELYVDDLIGVLARPVLSATEVDGCLARAAHGLMVLPAPTDPARMARLDEPSYLEVVRRLQSFASVLLLDCGTGLQEPALKAALAAADQLLLVSDAEPATATLVAEAGWRLARTGLPMTLVVNKMRSGRASRLDVDRMGSLLPTASGAVVVPDHAAAASRLAGGDFSWEAAPSSWRRAVAELAVTVQADWNRLGLCL